MKIRSKLAIFIVRCKVIVICVTAVASISLPEKANGSSFTYKGQYGCVRTDDGKAVCRSEASGKLGFVSESFFKDFSVALEQSKVKNEIPAALEKPEVKIEIRVSSTQGYSKQVLNVRSSPSAEASRLGTLAKGDQVSISGEVYEGDKLTDWIRINFRDSFGFVHRGYISDKPTVVAKVYDVEKFDQNLWDIAVELEVRSEPKNEFKVECGIKDSVIVVGRVMEKQKSSGWLQIEMSCGDILHPEDGGTGLGYVKELAFENAKVAINLTQEQASDFLKDVQDFVTLNQGVLNPVRLAILFQSASNELNDGGNGYKAASSKFVELYTYANAEPKFAEFHSDRVLFRVEEKAVAAVLLQKKMQNLLTSAQSAVAKDPLSTQAKGLAQILLEYESRSVPNDLEELQSEIRSLRNKFAALGFDGVSTDARPSTDKNNGETAKRRYFEDIGDNDVILVVNIFDGPPHAFQNLRGDVSFDNNSARLCAPEIDGYQPSYKKYIIQNFSTRFQNVNIDTVNGCSDGLQGIDGLLVRGVDLVRSKYIPDLRYLTEGLDQKRLVKVVLAEKARFDQKITELRATSKAITDHVSNSDKSGYGFIRVENSSLNLCVYVKGDQAVHAAIIKKYVGSEAFLNQPNVDLVSTSTLDEAFRKIQRSECRIIYADQADLKIMHEATQRLGLVTEFVPAWVDVQIFLEAKEKIEKQERQLAAMRSVAASQNQTKVLEEANRQAALREQLSVKRAELRARYGDRAKSLVSEINVAVLGSFNEIYAITGKKGSPDFSGNKFSFYNNLNRWFYDQALKGWVLDSVIPAIHEFGVVTWKGRNIEAVLAKIEVNIKNRSAGTYGQNCWYVGYVNDQEFAVMREPLSIECDDANAYQSWIDKLQFSSQWNP